MPTRIAASFAVFLGGQSAMPLGPDIPAGCPATCARVPQLAGNAFTQRDKGTGASHGCANYSKWPRPEHHEESVSERPQSATPRSHCRFRLAPHTRSLGFPVPGCPGKN